MGDQIGEALSGELFYIDRSEIDKLVKMQSNDEDTRLELLSNAFRFNCLYMIANAGSGHIGSSFSSMELFTYLKDRVLRKRQAADDDEDDIIFSSKGHDAPALYSVMTGIGELEFDLIHRLRKAGGLPGHPDVATNGVVTNTGSLGMGISKAKGFIWANRRKGIRRNVFVILGDGELQEGQIWESLGAAVNEAMDEMTVIVDHNKLQSDTLVSNVSDLGDLNAKFSSFGWAVLRCNGNDPKDIRETFAHAESILGRPKLIIADTIKGKGVSFMEHTSIDSDVDLYQFHSGAPSESAYSRAIRELEEKIKTGCEKLGVPEVLYKKSDVNQKPPTPLKPLKMIPTYSESLINQARSNEKIVALDADLILDTGLIPFQKEFPERFIECGIAEQDMVSRAGV